MEFFMRLNRRFKLQLIILALVSFLGGTIFNICQGKFNQNLKAAEQKNISNDPLLLSVKETLENSIDKGDEWPASVNFQGNTLNIQYTFNEDLTRYVKSLLRQYHTDYTTVTILDNETGKVLAAVGYKGADNKFDKKLVLTSTHPSASLIKVITSAELLEKTSVTKDTVFDFKGRSTTLFKYQLNDTKSRRATPQSFELAFAKSNNVIFGKAAIKNTTSDSLMRMAEGFGFNQPILKELPSLRSEISKALDDYNFAEIASGYNDETVISPIHAASISSIIANDGQMIKPTLIEKVVSQKSGENLWNYELEKKTVISPETSKAMKVMMAMTVEDGTARKPFKKMRLSYKDALDIGGKTGHITGGVPYGKRDWFSAYAVPKEKEKGKGISIAVMNVNVKKWHVKSSQLARNIIEYYYRTINPIVSNVPNDTTIEVDERINRRLKKKSKFKKSKIINSKIKKQKRA